MVSGKSLPTNTPKIPLATPTAPPAVDTATRAVPTATMMQATSTPRALARPTGPTTAVQAAQVEQDIEQNLREVFASAIDPSGPR
jgi:hypothetical protein